MKPRPVTHCPSPDEWIARLARRQIPGPGGCQLWTGRLDKDGYGRFGIREGGVRRETGAHRAAWLALRGDIPSHLVLDHLCRVRHCVNVEHLEVVTISVNALRGELQIPHPGQRKPLDQRKRCAAHDLSEGRWFTDKRGYTRWVCRACMRRYRAAYDRRRRAAAI